MRITPVTHNRGSPEMARPPSFGPFSSCQCSGGAGGVGATRNATEQLLCGEIRDQKIYSDIFQPNFESPQYLQSFFEAQGRIHLVPFFRPVSHI